MSSAYLIHCLTIRPMPYASKHDITRPVLVLDTLSFEWRPAIHQTKSRYRYPSTELLMGTQIRKIRGRERKKEEEAKNYKRREMECTTFTLGQLTGSGE